MYEWYGLMTDFNSDRDFITDFDTPDIGSWDDWHGWDGYSWIEAVIINNLFDGIGQGTTYE